LPGPLTKNAFGIFCVGVCEGAAEDRSLMVNKLAWIGEKRKRGIPKSKEQVANSKGRDSCLGFALCSLLFALLFFPLRALRLCVRSSQKNCAEGTGEGGEGLFF